MKHIIKVLIVVIIGVFSIDPYANYKIEKAFREKDADACYDGAAIKRRIWKHGEAAMIYNKIQMKFPDYQELDYVQYYKAYSYDKSDQPEKAITEYKLFINQYPNNEFHLIAKKKLSNLQANN